MTVSSRRLGDHFGNDFATTLDHAQHDLLVVMALLVLAADERLVGFHDAKAAEWAVAIYLAHILADFVAHAPSALVGHTQLPLQFLGGHAVTRSAEQVHGEQPELERRPGVLKGRVHAGVNVVAAVLTGVRLARLEPVEMRVLSTLSTGMTLPIAGSHYVLQAGFFVRVELEELADRQGLGHVPNLAIGVTCVKGICSP